MEANNDAGKQQNQSTQAVTTDGTGRMKLLVRTARVQKFIEVDENTNIKDLRHKAADAFDVDDPVLTVLIFGGKILKDHEDVRTHGIKDGQTIHLVIRNKPTTSANPTLTNSNQTSQQANQNASSTNPTINNNSNSNLNNNNNIPNSNSNNARQDFPSMNPLLGNLNDVQQRLQQMLISNPETMQNMINPLMQQMMSNPNTMRSLFGSMQRMHSLIERNPEVNHLLSNPDVLRESLEMVRNPAALQEVMRNYDRALNNMESMPGGYNVLRRMYTEFQEPLLSAFQENTNQFSSQPTAGENTNDPNRNHSGLEQQRTENRDPLPNPWAPPPQPTANSQGARTQFPIGLFGGGAGETGGLGGGLGAGLGAELESALGLGAALGGIGGPNLDGISNTNELLQRASTLFQDQEFMSLLTHPEALQSVAQIQQGFERLQRIAPNLFDRLGLPSLSRTNLGNNSDNNNSGSGGTDSNDKSDNDKDKSKKSDDGQDMG